MEVEFKLGPKGLSPILCVEDEITVHSSWSWVPKIFAAALVDNPELFTALMNEDELPPPGCHWEPEKAMVIAEDIIERLIAAHGIQAESSTAWVQDIFNNYDHADGFYLMLEWLPHAQRYGDEAVEAAMVALGEQYAHCMDDSYAGNWADHEEFAREFYENNSRSGSDPWVEQFIDFDAMGQYLAQDYHVTDSGHWFDLR